MPIAKREDALFTKELSVSLKTISLERSIQDYQGGGQCRGETLP